MSFSVTVLTLYPDMFPGPLSFSLTGKALKNDIWNLTTINIRDFATDKHSSVDDKPAGGGAGMVMRPDILASAIDSLPSTSAPRLLLSPRGTPFTQSRARELSKGEGIVLIAGHFEGVDERIIEARNLEEISIGDYILSGGEIASFAVLDSIIRLLPNVLGNSTSTTEESFENGLLEYPHYTTPDIWEGHQIPEILKSGDHAKVAQWRHSQSLSLTRHRRPDLLSKKK